jgi:hypothetical protein
MCHVRRLSKKNTSAAWEKTLAAHDASCGPVQVSGERQIDLERAQHHVRCSGPVLSVSSPEFQSFRNHVNSTEYS